MSRLDSVDRASLCVSRKSNTAVVSRFVMDDQQSSMTERPMYHESHSLRYLTHLSSMLKQDTTSSLDNWHPIDPASTALTWRPLPQQAPLFYRSASLSTMPVAVIKNNKLSNRHYPCMTATDNMSTRNRSQINSSRIVFCATKILMRSHRHY
jgi:hypothetical protein